MRLLLLLSCISIFALGTLMIFSTTSAEILDHNLTINLNSAFVKQLSYALLGLAGCKVVWAVGYKRLIAISPLLLALFSFLLLLILLPGIGHEVNGSRRWLSLAGISFQPSEFAKYLVPISFIQLIASNDKGKKLPLRTMVKAISLPSVAILLVLIEPDHSTAAVIALTLPLLCFLMRLPFSYWGIPLIAFTLIGGVYASHHPYTSARLKVYLHPETDLKGRGHQPYQAKIAVGGGGLLGRGPGNSLQKLSYLPEAQNDYLAAIYAEEFGFSGIAALLCLYSTIALAGYAIACRAKERQALYLAATIIYWICFQAFINLGVVSGFLPTTGLNLPLFSQGGSSLVANMMAIALLLAIPEGKKKL